MYQIIKTIATGLFPKGALFRLEPLLRSLYAFNKRGREHHCPVCGFDSREFQLLPNTDLLCHNCGSSSRDRRLWEILQTEHIRDGISVLDFSPSRCLYRKWKKQNVHYLASDLSGNFKSDVTYDITKISSPDNIFDLVVCYHILEHVVDDVAAMKELYRVTKPDAIIIIQTPFKDGEIYEDYSITSEADRLEHFGQEDHVRVYSADGLKNRLENAGFSVFVRAFQENDYLGLSANEVILFAKK